MGIVAVIFIIGILLMMFISIIGNYGGNQHLTDYELYGMDSDVYAKYMESSEDFKRGFSSAVQSMETSTRYELLNQAKNCLDDFKDDFDKGWNYALKNY